MRMSSRRFAFIIGTCLICTIGESKLPSGGNKSAFPYLLRGDAKDPCFNESTWTKKGECLQVLLEQYYGEFFTIRCPSLHFVLAKRECKGCPWDRVDVSKVNEFESGELNRSELFHPASHSCSIANYVEQYNDSHHIKRNVFGYGVMGMFLLSVLTAYYLLSSSSKASIEEGAKILDFKIPEPAFMLALWFLFYAVSFLLIVSEGQIMFCERMSGDMFQAAHLSFYGILLIISLKRCRALLVVGFEAGEVPNSSNVQSWDKYFAGSEPWLRRRVLSFLFGPIVIVFFLWDLLNQRSLSDAVLNNTTICLAGATSWRYFATQFVKVLLEIFVVTVYSCKPSLTRNWFHWRYSMLILSFLASIALIVLGWLQTDNVQMLSVVIPKIPSTKIALPLTNLLHVMCVSLMGLFEPVRIRGMSAHVQVNLRLNCECQLFTRIFCLTSDN